MCLLIVLARVHPDAPLVFAANRDEWLARPASAMEVLRDASFRTIGGRDAVAGGTWFAVNARGVVAALTNVRASGARDPSRRSRGELPLLIARHASAREAAEALPREVRAEEFNPCWILFGDRDALFYVDLGVPGAPAPRELHPGVYVLENNPLEAFSPKAAWVASAVQDHRAWRGEELVERLWSVLGSHEVPSSVMEEQAPNPREVMAACVHAGPYGTRWSAVVRVPAADLALPDLRYAEGTPCTTKPISAARFWTE